MQDMGTIIVDVGWCIGFTHAFGARGPGFNPTPKPRMAFFGSSHLPSFRQQTQKQFHSFVIL